MVKFEVVKRFLKKRYLVLLLVLLAVGWWWRSRSTATVEVKTATVKRQDLVSTLVVSGKVDAEKKASMTFPAAGTLAFVSVQNGDEVKRGQALAGLDLGDFQAAERAAWYNYQAADAQAKYVEDTVKNKDTSETFLEKSTRVTAQTTRDKAYDNWLTALRTVREATLYSPIAGRVTATSVTAAGDRVGVTDGVSVVDTSTLYFDIAVNETDISKVFVGQDVHISLDAFDGKTFVGKVKRIGYGTKIGDTGATVLPVWIQFVQGEVKPEDMKIGLNGDAELKLGEAKQALVLPIEAVRDGEVETRDGKKIKVATGLESDFDVEIKSGLNEGDVVVIK